MQAAGFGEALRGHALLGPDQLVAAFGSSGAENFAAAGGGHAGAESDVFSSFGFIRSVCRQHFVYLYGRPEGGPVYSCIKLNSPWPQMAAQKDLYIITYRRGDVQADFCFPRKY